MNVELVRIELSDCFVLDGVDRSNGNTCRASINYELPRPDGSMEERAVQGVGRNGQEALFAVLNTFYGVPIPPENVRAHVTANHRYPEGAPEGAFPNTTHIATVHLRYGIPDTPSSLFASSHVAHANPNKALALAYCKALEGIIAQASKSKLEIYR